MKSTISVLASLLFVLLIAGCGSPEQRDSSETQGQAPVDCTGTWATDGSGAGGVRTFVQKGSVMTGHFDEGRGRYDGRVEGRKLIGRFWWNEDATCKLAFEATPAAHRGRFEVTLGRSGNSFTGRSKFETGEWKSWNGLKTMVPAGPEEEFPTVDFSGLWATDGTGAGGVRTMMQDGNRLEGHFDDEKGRYDGEVRGWNLVGRFWWNPEGSGEISFEDTPAKHRGFFEVTQSADGTAFTGRSKYDEGEWKSWNGFRTGFLPESGEAPPVADFTGKWATDGVGAEGLRFMAQEDNMVTGHFDAGRGKYSGVVNGWFLVGRFWWNKDASKEISFEDTPPGQRGYFEVTQSTDGEAFTGRSRFEEGEWESWNGIKVE